MIIGKFGTDGIRGIYGKTLNEETAYRLGAALGSEGTLLVGRDNRPSSPALARALACGVNSVGGSVRSVGVVTTPALSYLLSRYGAKRAVMVTASHNPPSHNGLKVLTEKGKVSEEERQEIERRMDEVLPRLDPDFPLEERGDLSLYTSYIKERVGSLRGVKVVVDYAGGAGSACKGLYREMGAEEISLNAREDGSRINVGCGALCPEVCAREVTRQKADLGISIDGDGDRVLLVSRQGKVLDGDYVTYLLARRMKEKGLLRHDRVVMTVMTNRGIVRSLEQCGITVATCPVGDASVAERMREEDLNLGGEQSGHVILGDYLPTGDGLLVGAYLIKSLLEEGDFDRTPPPLLYPQILFSVPVPSASVLDHPAMKEIEEEVRASLGEGRLLLRASGTESVVRIMAEHADESVARSAADRIREAISRYA